METKKTKVSSAVRVAAFFAAAGPVASAFIAANWRLLQVWLVTLLGCFFIGCTPTAVISAVLVIVAAARIGGFSEKFNNELSKRAQKGDQQE